MGILVVGLLLHMIQLIIIIFNFRKIDRIPICFSELSFQKKFDVCVTSKYDTLAIQLYYTIMNVKDAWCIMKDELIETF
jgi:hypothetical protein